MPENSGILRKVIDFFQFGPGDDEMEETPQHVERDRSDKVVPLARRARQQHATEISIYSPQSFDDARVVADNLKEGRAVILNLTRLDVDLGKRIVDFVSGIIYALEGSSKKVGDNIFVFTPANIEITPDEEIAPAKETDAFFFQER